jgi:ABC-type transport system involved in multi-copper enzyme maturation permease subunit
MKYFTQIFTLSFQTSKNFLKFQNLISIFAIWIFFIFITIAFGTVSLGDRLLVIADIGLALSNFMPIVFICIGGANLLSDEIKRKSIYTVLTKPISRGQYLIGKLLGIWSASSIYSLILHLLLISLIYALEGTFKLVFINGFIISCFENLILSAICMLVSSIMVTPSLVGIITFAIFFGGRNFTFLSELSKGTIFEALVHLIPNLSFSIIINSLIYGASFNHNLLLNTVFYSISYVAIVMSIAIYLFQNKEFN